MNFGAIDIGSNAIRLLIARIESGEDGDSVKKVNFLRLPVRLGADVFTKGKISQNKKKVLATALAGYRHILDVYDVVDFRACATSAMRDARNCAEVVSYVEGKSGIKIEVIDGSLEAELIFSTYFAQHLDKDQSYLYIDVGGGSTEVTLIKKGEPVMARSFNIGTIRILNDLVKDSAWNDLKQWIEKVVGKSNDLMGIGTGGNINKIIKMTASKAEKRISLEKLKEFRAFLESYSVEDRVNILGLRPDRADVIVPASRIYTTILEKANISEMIVPKVGLADGIIYDLYRKRKAKI